MSKKAARADIHTTVTIEDKIRQSFGHFRRSLFLIQDGLVVRG